jgi:hypothetical protein
MYGRYKNSWKRLSDARLECMAKEFIKTELELALTFVKVAQTKYSMGNVAGGDFFRNNAGKAYNEAKLTTDTPSMPVLTENLDTDRVGIGDSKAELERPVQRDYFA